MHAAKSAWIAFLDSDDLWDPHKLERQVAYHREYPALRISHTEEIWIRNGREILQKRHHRKPEGVCFYDNLPFCKIAPSSVLMQKSLFEEVGGFDKNFPVCEDQDLWLRISRSYPIGLVKEALVTKYGGDGDQLSATPMIERWRIEALRKHLPDPKVAAEIEKKMKMLERGALRHKNEEILTYLERLRREIEAF